MNSYRRHIFRRQLANVIAGIVILLVVWLLSLVFGF